MPEVLVFDRITLIIQNKGRPPGSQVGAPVDDRMPTGRICLLSSVHLAHDVRLFQAEARTLARAGFDVTLIALEDTTESPTDGVHIISLPLPPNRLRRVTQTGHILRLALQQDADLFAIHDPELLLVAVVLRILTGRKVVYDVHENVPRQILGKPWLAGWLRHPVAAMAAIAERIASISFDGIVAATPSIAARFPPPPG